MKRGFVAVVIIAAVAFWTGRESSLPEPSRSVDRSVLGYQGGFEADAETAAAVDRAIDSGDIKQVAGGLPQREIVVQDGDSIQQAVRDAEPNTVIRIFPGRYAETVYIDKDGIRLIGEIVAGERPVLDGGGTLNDAVLYSGNNVVVENLKIVNYKGNGIMGQAGDNYVIRNNLIIDTGVYGIFPQLGINGVVEHNIVSEIADAAIYVGMSDHVHVAHNEVFDSVAGIEIENSRHAIVEDNYVHDNTGGILAFITPGLPIKTCEDVIIRHNFVVNNNTPNFGAPGSTVSGIPSGTGILIMAADDVVIEGNVITGNKTAAILVTDHANADNITADPEADPNSDRVAILENVIENNGFDTITAVKALQLSEFKTGPIDIVSVGAVNDSCIRARGRYRTVGIDDYDDCGFDNTAATVTYLLPPVAPREISAAERGKTTFLAVCSGCHAYRGG